MKGLIKKLLTKETVLYLVFGVLSTIINFVVFDLFNRTLGEEYVLVSETVAFIAAVCFLYQQAVRVREQRLVS